MMENIVRHGPRSDSACRKQGSHAHELRINLFRAPPWRWRAPCSRCAHHLAVYLPSSRSRGSRGRFPADGDDGVFGAVRIPSAGAHRRPWSRLSVEAVRSSQGKGLVHAPARPVCPPLARQMRHPLLTVAVAVVVFALGSGRCRSSARSSSRGSTKAPSSRDAGSPRSLLDESMQVSTRVERVIRGRYAERWQVVIDRPPGDRDRAHGRLPLRRLRDAKAEGLVAGRTDKEELVEAMAAALSRVPGLSVNFSQPIAMRLNEVISGVRADVAVKIYGHDTAVLARLGTRSST